MTQQNHIIQKLMVDIQASSEKEAYYIKDHISDYLRDEVLPRIEKLMDELIPQNQRVRFEQLGFDLKLDHWNQTDSLVSQIEKQIRSKLDGITSLQDLNAIQNGSNENHANTENRVHVVERTLNHEEIFFDFLRKGILPWYAGKTKLFLIWKGKNWKALLEVSSFVGKLQQLLAHDRNIMQRFIHQVPLNTILDLLVNVEIIRKNSLADLHDNLMCFSVGFRSQVLGAYLNIWVSGMEKDSLQISKLAEEYKAEKQGLQRGRGKSIEKWFHQYLNKKVLLKQLQNKQSEKLQDNSITERGHFVRRLNGNLENKPTIISRQAVTEREEESLKHVSARQEWMVENAGQVLLHPFIRLLFQNFSWVRDDGQLKAEFIELAVQALHYGNTGNDSFFEPDLILEKFLCGMPFHNSVPKACLLSRKMKREISILIKEVIRNWPELKNTSPVGLREGFIMRTGKLIKIENGYKLIVERKVQDVLLEKLNWNISIIKMPWQKEILFVEW